MFKNIPMLAGAMALALSGAQNVAAEDGTGLNIFAGPTYQMFGDNDLDDTAGGVIGLGYKFAKHWGVEATYIHLSETDYDTPGGDVDLDIDGYRADLLYYFNEKSNGVLPYLVFGGGEYDADIDQPGAGSDDQSFYNVGAGVKKYFHNNLALRGDIRAIRNTSESNTDLAFTVALDYFFGQRGSTTKVAAGPADSDGDGVYDDRDQCPNTPLGVSVDSVGCPLDSDGDGVYDYKDQCPNTPAGARVDEKGCQYVIEETVSVELEVLFDTDKAAVKPKFMEEMKNVAEFMKLFPDTEVTVEGHTDSRGDADYNQRLSQRRADAVRQVLIEKYGVAADRVNAIGYGETQPRASNETPEGMQQNRRVMAEIKTKVEKKATY